MPRLREVVLMGGGFFQRGNATVASEYNAFVDPRTAHKAFGSGVPVTMASIDSTHTALMTPEWLQRLRGTGRRTAIEAANLADFYRRYGDHKFPTPARPIHDACATGWLRAPELYEQRLCNVTIEIGSPDTMGDDHRRLVACHRQAPELQRPGAHRVRSLLRSPAALHRLDALTGEIGKDRGTRRPEPLPLPASREPPMEQSRHPRPRRPLAGR